MFRDDFVWGVASSAYQVEGHYEGDGAGENVWDRFTKEGRVYEGQRNIDGCDHLLHFEEDYALMRVLGISHYRFSLDWSRILPQGVGQVNAEAIRIYRKMIQSMLLNGITPYITMFHWEFPLALEDQGGWKNPESVQWFGEYAKVVAENFGDLCEYFITLNEPECFVGLGHLSGAHAPGKKLPYEEVFLIAHHALMAHGQAVINLRKYAGRDIQVGYAPTCGVALPYTDSPEDVEAARKVYFGFYNPMDNWTWNVAWFSDPVFLGHYPEHGCEQFREYLPEITEEDMKLIHQPIDFMGQNIYNGYFIRAGKDGEPEYVNRFPGFPRTAANWPITPNCLYYGIKFLYERYQLPIYITENGMSCHDAVSLDGRVHDPNRIDLLERYIHALWRATEDGADVRGYFLWTFLDNFEWDKGYNERFGLVHVDFQTKKRIVKDSAYWYSNVIKSNGRSLELHRARASKELFVVRPELKERIWGGKRLGEVFPYELPSDHVGECWAVSAHPNGDCQIAGGTYDGKTLSWLYRNRPELFGNLSQNEFPLLIKLIDAKDDLSIQVHPDDTYALQSGEGTLGKTECWYILDCPEDATLIVGHHARTKNELEAMVMQDRYEELLREVPVKKGDFVQIDPGTVHAIKGGLLLLEIQQSSDITYRVYDYHRLEDGKPRTLHVEQSLDVITVPAIPAEECITHWNNKTKDEWTLLGQSDYYHVFLSQVESGFSFIQEAPFALLSVVEGDGLICGRYVRKGDHLLVPNGFGEVTLYGSMQVVMSTI